MKGPVELHVAAVAGGHDAGDAQPRRRPALGSQGLKRLLGGPGRPGVLVGAQARRRMTGVYHPLLAPARALPPQPGSGQAGEQTGRRRPGREKVRRRQDGLGPGHLEVCVCRQSQPGQLDRALDICPIHRTPPGSIRVECNTAQAGRHGRAGGGQAGRGLRRDPDDGLAGTGRQERARRPLAPPRGR